MILFLALSVLPASAALDVYGLQAEALAGDVKAQFKLGLIYETGEEGYVDPYESAKWYEMAVAQGLREAQLNLGRMYSAGAGVSQDYEKAAELFLLAAEQEQAEAQTNLAVFYLKGKGSNRAFLMR